jgi:guanylate kinase
MRNSKTLIITGKSSVGKDTILRELVDNYDFVGLISHTTRPIRPNEENGRDYYFTTKEQFMDIKNKNQFIETREYKVKDFNGNDDTWHYGLSKMEYNICNIFNKVVIVDMKGFHELAEYIGRDNCFMLYLYCDDNIRRDRMIGRGGMSPEEIERRFKADEEDFKSAMVESDLSVNTGDNSTEKIARFIAGVMKIEQE